MKKTVLIFALIACLPLSATAKKNVKLTVASDNTRVYVSQRPDAADRLFKSQAVENKISEIAKLLKNKKLAWMFTNCYPNTLDTTVHYRVLDGTDDTFVYTGDIHAMWLRDSGAQVYPYIHRLCEKPTRHRNEGKARRGV